MNGSRVRGGEGRFITFVFFFIDKKGDSIENNKINVLWCYRMLKEIKFLRQERRKIKNDMELLSKYNEHKNKIISKDNRQFLLTEVYKKEKTLGKKYVNKQYTEDEMQKIIKGV